VTQSTRENVEMSAEEFGALFSALRTWGEWGDRDERGAMNYLQPDGVASAARLVRDGTSISLSLPLDTKPAAHNPEPAVVRMTTHSGVDADTGPLHLAKDYIGVNYHSDGHTHIDALCHIAYDGLMYNGVPEEAVTSTGATADSIEAVVDGVIGRGVLLDIPRVRGVPWLEPGEHVFREDLEAAERRQAVVIETGDILLVRTGHTRRLREFGSWDTPNAKAGLHPTAMRFVADRKVAVLGSDGNSDTAPGRTEGVAFPIHVLAITAMGVHLLDYLQLEDLLAACERLGRWEFLFVGAPLRIAGGTGSPLNPVALF
jgi:kynurenine formamidase